MSIPDRLKIIIGGFWPRLDPELRKGSSQGLLIAEDLRPRSGLGAAVQLWVAGRLLGWMSAVFACLRSVVEEVVLAAKPAGTFEYPMTYLSLKIGADRPSPAQRPGP